MTSTERATIARRNQRAAALRVAMRNRRAMLEQSNQTRAFPLSRRVR